MSKPLLTLTDAQTLPFTIRVSIWILCGAALGLSVDDLLTAINQQLAAARKHAKGRLRMSLIERLAHAKVMERLAGPFRDLFQWIVSPASLIRWLKRYQQRKANGTDKPTAKPGRPWISAEKVAAILNIYDSGLTGLSRIVGEMVKNDLPVVESTVRRVLTANARPPTDHNHRTGSTWAQFWKHHARHTVGIDFIQLPIGLLGKIVNAFVFVAIEHDTRRVHLLGITIHPTDAWCAQAVRNATMDGHPLAGRKHWILDNDGKYGKSTAAVLGKKRLIWTSIRAPDMNAYCERFVKSISEECLNHVVFLSEEHLREYVIGYLEHYNEVRPHQGIGNVPIGSWEVGTGELVCDESLHGLLKSFRRAA